MSDTTGDYSDSSMNGNDDYEDSVYQAFDFEHPIYLYIWEILTVISTVIAGLFILTLTRKKLRSVTSYILCAISISDSLTGLSTLPTYIMVYDKLEIADDHSGAQMNGNESSVYDYSDPKNAYIISPPLCEAFMLSKHFLSKLFHTISIWLTVFLGVTRCVTIWSPLRAPYWFSKGKRKVIYLSIVLLAPVLHGYHVFKRKVEKGMCEWSAKPDCSDGTCIQLWVELVVRHLIPCTTLTVTAIFLVKKLSASSFTSSRTSSIRRFRDGREVRDEEQRHVTNIVMVIVMVFLLTEVPYGVFLFYYSVVHVSKRPHLGTNRAIHAIYELTIVVSANANFVIYTTFNKRIRDELRRVLLCKRNPEGVSRSQSQSQSTSTKR